MNSTINIDSNCDISPSNLSILDLSQRSTTMNITHSAVFIDDWMNDIPCKYTDAIDNDIQKVQTEKTFNIEQSLTEQFQRPQKKQYFLLDNLKINKSKLDCSTSLKRTK